MNKTLLLSASFVFAFLSSYTQSPSSKLDCFSVGSIICGIPLENQDNSFAVNNIDTFRAFGYTQVGNTGPEMLYYFDVFFQQEVTITLDVLSEEDDFELILLLDCDENTGLTYSVNPPGVDEVITVELKAGRYYILVEGYDGTIGTFNLRVDWDCEEMLETEPVSLECGQTLEGSTVGFSNDFNFIDYTDCIGEFSLNYYDFKDALYRFELLTTQIVKIDLEILTDELNLDLLLLASEYPQGALDDPKPGTCIAVSEYLSPSEKTLYVELEPGTYWVGVDGGLIGDWFGPLPPDQGLFNLTLNCFYLFTPCDLSGEFITNGPTVIRGGVGLLESVYFTGISCLAKDYNLPSQLLGSVYTYYSEETILTNIELNSESVETNVYVFDCSAASKEELCIATTTGSFNKDLSFNAQAGNYYQILILAPDPEAPAYQLKINSPEGPCSNDIPEVLQEGWFIEGTLEKGGNDFDLENSAFFLNCSSGDSSYDGEDLVFQLDVNFESGNINLGVDGETITLEAESKMGLFLFNYQCGGQYCMAKIELPEGGGKDSMNLDDYITKAGTYYLILDKASPSGSNHFTLKRNDDNSVILCLPNESEVHTINFADNILNQQNFLEQEDRFIVDYQEKKFIGETLYASYDRSINGFNGSIDDIFLYKQDPAILLINDSIPEQVCGFENGQGFVFKVLKEDGLVLELDPVFDESPIFANPPTVFKSGATTFVKELKLKGAQQLIKVDFAPDNANLNALPYTDFSFNGHIDVNRGWEIVKPSSSNWINIYGAQEGEEGLLLTQGKGPTKVRLQVDGNPGSEIRQGIFEIVAENGLARRVRVNQLPNPCGPTTIAISSNITDVACKGNAGGAIQLSTGDGQMLIFKWEDGAEGPVRDNLPAGNYRVSVSDQNGCASVLDYTVKEPTEDLTIDLTVPSSEICSDEVTLANTVVSGGTPAYAVLWSDGTTGLFNSGLPPGTHAVMVTDANNCTATKNFQIEAFPLQAVQIAGNESFCNGDSTMLALPGFQAYQWNTGATAASIVIKTSGNYSVVAKDENGCQVEASVQVDVFDKPQPAIAGSTSICPGGSTELSLNGYSSYLWSNGENTSSIVRSTPGDISVTVTNAAGCSGETSLQIVENEELQPQIVGDSDLCRGEQTTLDAGSFASYSWSTGVATRTIAVVEPGDYRVTVSDQNGCEGVDVFSVRVNDNPQPSIDGNTFLCFGGSSILSVSGNFTNYAWSNSSLMSATEVSSSGRYRVSVTDENGCMGVDEVEVLVNPEMVLQEEWKDISCFGANDGRISIQAAGGTGELTFSWNPGLGNLSEVAALAPGVYELTVTDENDCSVMRTVELEEPPALTLALDSIQNVNGDSPGFIMVSTTGGTPPYTYFWSWPGGFRLTNVPSSGELQVGSYEVKVEDANDCTLVLENVKIDQVVSAQDLFSGGNSLIVYPNPGKGAFYLEWQQPLPDEVMVRIVNGIGSTVGSLYIPRFTQRHFIDLSQHPSGIYFFIFSGNGAQLTRKIVVE